MKKALLILGGIVVLLVLAVVIVPPMAGGFIARQIASTVRQDTGRDLAVEDLSLSVFPTMRVSASKVVLRDAPGSANPPLLELGPTVMEVAVAPLLTGTLDVTRLAVEGARARLAVDEHRRPNWAPSGTEAGRPSEHGPEREGEAPAGFSDVRFRNVRLSGVEVTYDDRATGRSVTLTDGRFGLEAPGLDNPANVEGHAVVNGRAVDLAGSVGSPRALFQGQPTTATGWLDAADLVKASLNLEPAEDGAASGKVQATIPSMEAVLDWLAVPVGTYAGPKSFQVQAGLRLADGRTEVNDLSLQADDVTARGNLAVDTRGARPKIQGAVDVSEIRLDRFVPAAEAQRNTEATPPGGAAPRERGGGRAGGGDPNAPLPWESLKQVDAELTATIEGIVFRQDRIGKTLLDVHLDNGVMEVRLDGKSVLGGQVEAVVTANAGSNSMTVAADLDKIRFAPLVPRFSDLRLAEGTAAGQVDIQAQGKTQAELAKSMKGRARIAANGQGMSVPRPGKPLEIDRFDVTLDMPSEAGPLSLSGDAALQKKPVSFRMEVARPTDLAGGGASPVVLDVDGGLGSARFRGDIAKDKAVSGQLALDIPSLPDLAAVAGEPLPPGVAVRHVRYEGGVQTRAETAALKDFTLALDEVQAKGTASADWSGAVPGLVARIALSSPVDLDRLLPRGPAAGEAPKGAPQQKGAASAPSSGWSEEPMGLSALRSIDLDAVIESAGLKFGDIQLGPSTIRAMLKGGALALDAAQVPAFDGQADIAVKIDAARSPAATALTLKATGARAEKVLAAVAGSQLVTGAAALDVDVTASGDSQKAMVSSLNGTTSLHLKDGALRGINVAAILRDPVAAATGRIPDIGRETDFSDLNGSFRIANGVATTDDLRMAAPLFRIAGSGTVSLPDRRFDLRLIPTAVATLEGQGSEFERSGLQIPVLIRGTFESPQVQPDFSGVATTILKDPGKAAEAVRRLKEGGSAKDIFEALTGGGQPAPAAPPEAGAAPAPGGAQPQPAPSPAPPPAPPPGGAPADLLQQGLKQLFGR